MASAEMLEWQYRQILAELAQIQLHASDQSCPCVLGIEGEFCLAKHSLLVSSLAAETSFMETDKDKASLCLKLQEEATDVHLTLKDRSCTEDTDHTDAAGWAREWRKRVEALYYVCITTTHNQPCTMEADMDPLITEITAQICPSGACASQQPMTAEKCSTPDRKRLESCIRQVKSANRDEGCKRTGTRKCPSPFAVCTAAVGCSLKQDSTMEKCVDERLIAMAPEMLAALQAVEELIEGEDLPDSGELSGAAISDLVRDIVARATNKPTTEQRSQEQELVHV